MYKFRKVKMKDTESNGVWYFIPEDRNQVIEHWKKFCITEMSEGMGEISNNLIRKAQGLFEEHYTTPFGSTVGMLSEIKQIPVWQSAVELENEIMNNRLHDVDCGDIYLTDGLTQFGYVNSLHEIIDEVVLDKLEYPTHQNLTIDDFRFLQWYGGEHWYVKLGNMDIVDEHGNQKWNTREEAKDVVRKYITGQI